MASVRTESNSLERKGIGKRETIPLITVVCAGKITEPTYFQDFSTFARTPLLQVIGVGEYGAPLRVVSRAIDEKATLARQARKSKDSFDARYEVWAVFDLDATGRDASEAITLAESNGINLAVSNPCFEVWALMHFSNCEQSVHRHEAMLELKRCMPTYCPEQNPVIDVSVLALRYASAVDAAAIAYETNSGPTSDTPFSSVYKLTERIREFGRK